MLQYCPCHQSHQYYQFHPFRPLNPSPGTVCREDIAHALAMKCRWTGHCSQFLSIAQHSVLVSCLAELLFVSERSGGVGPSDAECRFVGALGLLHDAAEAYLPDVSRPIKRAAGFLAGAGWVSFETAETKVLSTILDVFGLGMDLETIVPGIGSYVKRADDLILAREADLFMGGREGWVWAPDGPVPEFPISDLSPSAAKALFQTRWDEVLPVVGRP